ncbi:NAD(P)-binding protein [Vibrio sagamiensis]|nr:NAD(P)-binding protein [Vibrio sagamiensis]PNQ64236.1 FAD-dependent oxidoreductase [Vibrio agarivorans]
MKPKISDNKNKHIAVIGGGVAGATAAIHFSELGFHVSVLEKGPSLVNGPPICHLHAGGNLYREISEQHCLELLTQSVETIRLYPHSLNIRPTLIAVPESDGGEPKDLIPRLEVIKKAYQKMVLADSRNQVLGDPETYFKLYSKQDLKLLAKKVQPKTPKTIDEWCIPFAQNVDLEMLKYPVVAVQEYGWSVFRLAAIANMTLLDSDNANVCLNAKLSNAQWDGKKWHLTYQQNDENHPLHCDYLVNACGFETGAIDDNVGLKRERLVEFKSAYVTHWQACTQMWPEVIFHGPRGTDKGMAQLTPYRNGYFQLHGMTKDITLFQGGLVKSTAYSAQPKLPLQYLSKIYQGWQPEVLQQRTNSAIQHMAQFIPNYQSAKQGGKALFGAQQIPGKDPILRAADVTFEENNYARIEVVKASSTLLAAQKIVQHWFNLSKSTEIEQQHPITVHWSPKEIEQYATQLCYDRGYPPELANFYGVYP